MGASAALLIGAGAAANFGAMFQRLRRGRDTAADSLPQIPGEGEAPERGNGRGVSLGLRGYGGGGGGGGGVQPLLRLEAQWRLGLHCGGVDVALLPCAQRSSPSRSPLSISSCMLFGIDSFFRAAGGKIHLPEENSIPGGRLKARRVSSVSSLCTGFEQ